MWRAALVERSVSVERDGNWNGEGCEGGRSATCCARVPRHVPTRAIARAGDATGPLFRPRSSPHFSPHLA